MSFVRRHPVAAFCVSAYVLGWPLLLQYTLTSQDPTTGRLLIGLVISFGVLFGSALAVTRIADGPGGAGRFVRRCVAWRFGLLRWALVVGAIPVLTVVVGSLAGSLRTPERGWPVGLALLAYQLFVVAALGVNLPEEAAWAGLVQHRFSARFGLFGGALATSPLFVAMHLPIMFGPGWTWGRVAAGLGVMIVIAPVFRYLIGETMLATNGSILAAGVLHASFNTSSGLTSDGWEYLAATILLAAAIAGYRSRWWALLRRRSSVGIRAAVGSSPT